MNENCKKIMETDFDFSKISPEDALDIVGRFPKLNPEQRLNLINKLNELMPSLKEGIDQVCQAATQNIDSNKDIQKNESLVAIETIKALGEIAKKDSLSADDIMQIAQMINETRRSSDNVAHSAINENSKIVKGVCWGICTLFVCGFAYFAGKGKINSSDINKVVKTIKK